MKGLPCYVRKPRGRDIYAACGQLKRTVEDGMVSQLVGAVPKAEIEKLLNSNL